MLRFFPPRHVSLPRDTACAGGQERPTLTFRLIVRDTNYSSFLTFLKCAIGGQAIAGMGAVKARGGTTGWWDAAGAS